mgnify:FL=1
MILSQIMPAFLYFLSQSKERNHMGDTNKGVPSASIRVPKKKQEEYVVQFVFDLPDIELDEGESAGIFDDTLGYAFHIYASSIMEATDRAWQVLMVIKAEQMTTYPGILESIDADEFDAHNLMHFREFLEEKGMFKQWMLLEPIGMQACLADDEETLKSFTADVIYSEMSNTVSDVEDFLKDK